MATDRIRAALTHPGQVLECAGTRAAAVALLIDPQERLLFVQRAEREGDRWSGQIGLPGGHLEGEESWLQAAIRETHEEIGVNLGLGSLLGTLDDLKTPGVDPSRIVRPHVFAVPSLQTGTLQPSEVAAVHRVSLASLLSGVGRNRFELDYANQSWTLPCVHFGGQRLWGLTLRMIDDLLHRIDGRGRGLERPCAPGVLHSGLF